MKLQRVGDYLLGEKLGEGSFAKVRVGLHVMSREKVSELFYLFDSAKKKTQWELAQQEICHLKRRKEALTGIKTDEKWA